MLQAERSINSTKSSVTILSRSATNVRLTATSRETILSIDDAGTANRRGFSSRDRPIPSACIRGCIIAMELIRSSYVNAAMTEAHAFNRAPSRREKPGSSSLKQFLWVRKTLSLPRESPSMQWTDEDLVTGARRSRQKGPSANLRLAHV